MAENDNLRDEYSPLIPDVPRDIKFASEGLDKNPDAVNLWLGNECSTTALHKDNYENIYVQIRGEKHFTLLPPVEMPCVNETNLSRGRYMPTEGSNGKLSIIADEGAEHVPVPVWDPDEPTKRATAYSKLSNPTKLTLKESDMLYLPAMWYHKVEQSSGKEQFACSVNYW